MFGPNFFTGNKWNVNQTGLLNKMIPFMKVLGGAWGSIVAHGLIYLLLTIYIS